MNAKNQQSCFVGVNEGEGEAAQASVLVSTKLVLNSAIHLDSLEGAYYVALILTVILHMKIFTIARDKNHKDRDFTTGEEGVTQRVKIHGLIASSPHVLA